MENTTAQRTPSNHMKASGVYAGSFSRQERTRYRYTATGWYSMIHPQLNCPRYLSMEKITPEAYISTRMKWGSRDRKSTRLNSSHVAISYAVFCLKKKTT